MFSFIVDNQQRRVVGATTKIQDCPPKKSERKACHARGGDPSAPLHRREEFDIPTHSPAARIGRV